MFWIVVLVYLEVHKTYPWEAYFKKFKFPALYPGIASVGLGLGCGPGITTFKNSITGGSETTARETAQRDGKVQFSIVWRQVDGFRFRIGGLLPDTITESLQPLV